MPSVIKAGTKNPVKLAAITEAFARCVGEVEVKGYEVQSHVPAQPLNEQTYQGAENRILELKKHSKEHYDFLVACEGGIICQFGRYFNVQVIVVEDCKGRKGFGLSQGYQIPENLIEEALRTDVASVLDRQFEGEGGIRMLTKGQFTREKLVQDGTIMALTRLINGEEW